ncbi:hypothetical protein VTO42DRAFT_8573 [Malbranchea cinnamomea]
MLDFMEYIQRSFSEASQWNPDNSYSALTDTAKAVLDFSTPERFRVHLSSLSTPQFATSYTLGTVGMIDGSVSYLFSTLPLNNISSQSNQIPLRLLVPGYRQIYAPVSSPLRDWTWQDQPRWSAEESEGSSADGTENRRKPTLLHATLHLPPPTTLTALFLRRLSPTTQLSLALSSSQAPPPYKSVPQASILTQLSYDTGKYSSEFIFSTDGALIGLRGLWNFGLVPRKAALDSPRPGPSPKSSSSPSPPRPVSLISAGGEFYYSPVSRVVGLSTGLRLTTLPTATGTGASAPNGQATSAISTFPYTLTLTLTPLTGSLSTTYSLVASPNLAFSSRFGFNVYSWESEMVAGCEIWRRKRPVASKKEASSVAGPSDNLEWARRKMGLHDSTSAVSLSGDSDAISSPASGERESSSSPSTSDSVIKIRVDQSWNIRLLWEGRVKDLLVSAGVGLGPSGRSSIYSSSSSTGTAEAPRCSYGWTGVGVSILYSS